MSVRASWARWMLALAGAASLLALAGCGGGGSTRPAAYVAQGNAICAQELSVLHRYPEPATPAQALTYLPHAIGTLEHTSARLSALSLPTKARAQLGAALGAGSQLVGVLRGFLGKLRSSTIELATFAQVQTQSNALRAQMNAHLREAHLTSCVSG
jgi:hypothetical protein